MRKLTWFAVGFAAACACFIWLMKECWVLPVCSAAGILAAVLLFLSRRQEALRLGVWILLGFALGGVWFDVYHSAYLAPVEPLDGKTMLLTVTASDYSRETAYGICVDGTVTLGEREYPVTAYLKEARALFPGDRVAGDFRLRLTALSGKDGISYYSSKGIFLLAYQAGDASVTSGEEDSLRFLPAVLRKWVISALDALFAPEIAAFARALLLGDTSGLDYATELSFRLSGIRHIVAVSGLHVSMLYGAVELITFRRRYLTALLGLPVLLLFAAVAGFTPSVMRSCLMVGLMLLARVFSREYDSFTALGFAVVVMLLCNPLVITSAGFQMSVLCVAGVLCFANPISSWLRHGLPKGKGIVRKLLNALCGSTSISISAMSFVIPLSAIYFGSISLISPVTNLLTLWAVNLVFCGLALVCLLYPVLPALAGMMASVLTVLIRFVLKTAQILGELPLASVYTASDYTALWLLFVYILLAVFLLSRKKRPGVLICCGLLGLCVALMASWAEPLVSDTSVTMLDVGQGQAILLESQGKVFLVDCGGDSDTDAADTVAEALLSRGIFRMDGIILTHFDRDHAGGLPYLLSRMDAQLILLPDTVGAPLLSGTDSRVIYVREDLTLSFGDARLTVFGPIYSGNDNENSLCVLFDTEKCDILITGDRGGFGERMLLRRSTLQDVDILVAGHHGAAESTTQQLLETVTPETVLISVGKGNVYGHPSPALLQRLAEYGCSVYRTDLHGTITIGR